MRSNYHCYARGLSMQPSRLGKLCVCVCTLIGLTCLLAPSVHIHVAQNSVGYTFGLSTAELSRAALWVGEHRGARLFFLKWESKKTMEIYLARRRRLRNWKGGKSVIDLWLFAGRAWELGGRDGFFFVLFI